jgi:hypothetical protein
METRSIPTAREILRERLAPVMGEVGVQMSGEPEVFEVRELQKR